MIRTARIILVGLFASILCACSTTSTFIEQEPVEPITLYLAGVSFTGDFSNRSINYPYCYSISKEGQLDRAFVEELSKHQFSYITLTTGLGESTNASDAIAASLGINLETVATTYVERVGYKTVADIYAEILIFDFDSKKIITSLPINMQYITVTKEKPSSKYLRGIFKGMIFGSDKNVEKSLFKLAAEKLESAKIKQSYGARFKVDAVSLNARSTKGISGDLNVSKQQYESIAAQMLTRSLVDNLKVAVVPYTKGELIGSKMPARFSNGDAFMFELPPADYSFKVQLKRFEKETDESNPGLDVEAYYVFLRMMFEQPDLGKTYLDRNFAGVTTTTLIKGQKNNSGVAYLETLLNFFEGFTENIAKPDVEWIKNVVHPDNVKATELQLEEIRDLVNKNR